MSPLLALLLLLSALGLLVLLLGFRGRLVGERPYCSSCGFDLSGTPLKSAPCPECGADLTKGLAVRRGRRTRRPWFVATGAGLTLLSLAAFGSLVWGASTNFNWNTIKPDWLLVMNTDSTDPASAAPALDELMSRYSNGSLGHKHVRRLLERGLRIQANPEAPWLTEWGDFIVWGWRQGDLTADEMQAYARRGLSTDVRLPHRFYADWSLSPALAVWGHRLGDALPLFVHLEVVDLTVGGRTLHPPASAGMSGALPGQMPWFVVGRVGQLPPGEHELHSTWRISASASPQPDSRMDSWTVSHTTNVTVIAPGEPFFRLIDDPSAAEPIAAGIRILSISATPAGQDRSTVDVRVRVDPLPHTISMRIFLRADGTEHPLTWIVYRKGEPAVEHSAGTYVVGLNVRRVDVILRTDLTPAESTPGVDNIWNGEILLKDVPVHWPEGSPNSPHVPPPSAQPSSP